MKPKKLPDAEFQIMDLIWDAEPPVTTTLVMNAIGREKGWKIQTVVSLFSRLTERGFLRPEKGPSRERLFYPLISREEYLEMETRSFINHYHKKSVVSLISSLHTDELSEDDLDELTAWVRQARKKED